MSERRTARDFDWITAAFLLAFVAALANLLRAIDAPWPCFVLLWIFAAKWVLLLALPDPSPSLR